MDPEILLYINLFVLVLNGRLIYISYKRNKFVNLIYHSVFLFLVTGQSVNISSNLQDDTEVLYLANKINADGHLISSIFLVYCMMVFYLFEYLYKKRNLKPIISNEIAIKKNAKFSYGYYCLLWMAFLLITTSMVLLVGLDSIVNDDRPGASGNTFFLIGLALCIYPLIMKIISNSRLSWKETVLFGATFIVTLAFSRMTAIFHLMLILIAGYYSGYNSYRTPLSSYRKYFIWIPIVIIIFFFGYGTWRQLKNFTDARDLPLGALFNYALEHPERTLFSLNINYRFGIEGISGLSGIMTRYCEQPFFKMDGGLSIIAGVITLIPSFFRGPFLDLQNYFASLYWYNQSVVPSGVEASFVHFNFFGLFIYPIFLAWYFNSLNKKVSTKTRGKFSVLTTYVFIIYGLLLIRGSSSVYIFFLISNLVIAKLSIFIFKIFNSPVKPTIK